jgi:hypothetical protein
MSSKARKAKAAQPILFSTVETNSKLLDLLEIATTHDRKAIFIQSLLEILPTAFARFDKPPVDLFNIFTTWFGNYAQSETLLPGISAALHHRQKYFLDNRKVKRGFICDIGLDWTVEFKTSSISKVNFVE